MGLNAITAHQPDAAAHQPDAAANVHDAAANVHGALRPRVDSLSRALRLLLPDATCRIVLPREATALVAKAGFARGLILRGLARVRVQTSDNSAAEPALFRVHELAMLEAVAAEATRACATGAAADPMPKEWHSEECPLCLDRLKAVVLPHCSHSFCAECYETIKSQRMASCPLCRRSIWQESSDENFALETHSQHDLADHIASLTTRARELIDARRVTAIVLSKFADWPSNQEEDSESPSSPAPEVSSAARRELPPEVQAKQLELNDATARGDMNAVLTLTNELLELEG